MSESPQSSVQTVTRHGNIVNGEVVAAIDDGWAEIIDPITEQVVAEVPDGDEEDVDRAVEAAALAFPQWSSSTPAERSVALLRLADLVQREREAFAQAEALDVGKPLSGAREEVDGAIDAIRFFAGAARCLEAPATGEYTRGHTSFIRRDPVGVVGQIAPWNFPLSTAVLKIAPALAAGNTCVFKPSELTPLTALMLGQHATEVLPAGALNVVTGDGERVGARIVAHPEVPVVSMTGSTDTGKAIARAAADSLKRVHLELGGKAPVVVFDDADLDEVVAAVRLAGFYNAGQDCTAATRLLVSRSIQDDLIERLVPAVESLTLPSSVGLEDFELGPVISAPQRERVLGFVTRSAAEGAQVLTGGKMPEGSGFFVEATVVAGVQQRSEIVQQEVFGPVVTVQSFDHEADALADANDVRYGLAASVFTRDVERVMRLTRALRFGTVWVNCHLVLAHEMPHGGLKESGYGKDLSIYGLEQYTDAKHLMIRSGPS